MRTLIPIECNMVTECDTHVLTKRELRRLGQPDPYPSFHDDDPVAAISTNVRRTMIARFASVNLLIGEEFGALGSRWVATATHSKDGTTTVQAIEVAQL